MMRFPEEYKSFFILLWRGIGLPCNEALSLPIPAEEWMSIYETSRRQAVCGLVFSAVEELPSTCGIPEDLFLIWQADVKRIEADFVKVGRVVAKQRTTWEKRGINAVLLKGLESADMYPVPERRTSGDIDWWMPSGKDWDAAIEVLEDNGIDWTVDSDGDIRYCLGGVPVEHHHDGLPVQGITGRLYLCCEHILKHAMVAGVGLKQVCDYFVALKAFEGRYDELAYYNLLEKGGLVKWEAALRGLDPDLIRLVMYDGNMGIDKKRRYSGFFVRTRIFFRLCPGLFIKRWFGLIFGRIRRIL